MSTAIIEKVRKLINLGTNQGATDGERENAMRMAHALLAKHNLSLNDLEVDTNDRIEDFLDIWQDRYMITSAHAMAKLFFCKPYITRTIGEKGRDRFFFIGRKDNVETAKLMTEYVIKSIRSEMNKLKMGNSFANGAASRVYQRVMEIVENPESEEISSSTALAVVSLYKSEDEANAEFLKAKGTNLVASRTVKQKQNAAQYQAGREFGNKINLNLQVEGKAAPRAKQISHK